MSLLNPKNQVTLRKLSLGSADSTTGWFEKEWAEDETINMIILPRGAPLLGSGMGTYAKYEITGYCIEPVSEGDEIYRSEDDSYYEVKTVQPHLEPSGGFAFYEVELVKLRLHE